MAKPIVEYYNETGTEKVESWPIGEVDAGSESRTMKVTLWNNKGGESVVSNMKNVTVTCLDGNGGLDDVMVTQKWMNVSINGNATFTEIGGNEAFAPVQAKGATEDDGNIIFGTVNDGTLENATANYSEMDFKVVIPANAEEGLHNFIISTTYFYT